MNDKTKNTLIVVLVCVVAILSLLIVFVLGMNYADKENGTINTEENQNKNDNENNDLNQVINCNGNFAHQYGEAIQQKKYIFSNNQLKSIESITKYDFGTEELSKNMNTKMNNCGLYNENIDCNSTQDGQYVIVTVNIKENNLNDSEYSKYKNLTIDDVLNKNITDNDIFNNQNMTCTK